MVARMKYILILLVLLIALIGCCKDEDKDSNTIETFGQLYDLMMSQEWVFEITLEEESETDTHYRADFSGDCQDNNPNLFDPEVDIFTLSLNGTVYPLVLYSKNKYFELELSGSGYIDIPKSNSYEVVIKHNTETIYSAKISTPSKVTNFVYPNYPNFDQDINLSWQIGKSSNIQAVRYYGATNHSGSSRSDIISPAKRSHTIQAYSLDFDAILEEWMFGLIESNYKEYQNKLCVLTYSILESNFDYKKASPPAGLLEQLREKRK